jgi:GAF domain-containing protein/anti-sigma regulatory factor (Ser/Thr protein kinase)
MSSHVPTPGVERDLSAKVQELERELTEARQQQAATAEILRAISRSQTDVQRVFDTIITSAVELCEALQGAVYLYDGKLVHFGAHRNYSPETIEVLERMYPRPPLPDQVSGRAILNRAIAQIEDSLADPLYVRELALAGGWRSQLAVPMFRNGEPIGAIVITRPEAGPFSASHIELLQTFADQAVIAIENTRLFEEVQARTRELTEALERQTATSEVLGIISSSPGELKPVFETMLANAMRICEARFGHLLLYDGEAFHAAHLEGLPAAYRELWERGPIRPNPNTGLGRIVRTKRVVHIPDLTADAACSERDPLRLATVELAGARSFLSVPMLKESQLVGAIVIYRQEIRPFTEKQIELVTSFANQAVIAIENTRLLNELRESLQQQTATSDVLKTISRSAFDLQNVLDTLVEAAVRLCAADGGLIRRREGEGYELAATFGFSEEFKADVTTQIVVPGRASIVGRVALERKTVAVADVLADPEFDRHQWQKLGGFRSTVGLPLLRDEELLGVLLLHRKEARPFTYQQISLLETFADQAVIAIENTRLFEEVQARTHELQESLEYQTAIFDVLSVISKSPHALQPVLDAIMTTAARLCQSTQAHVRLLREDGAFHIAAHRIYDPELLELLRANPFRPSLDSVAGRAALRGVPVHVPDVAADPLISGFQRSISDRVRTALSVPLKRNGVVVGLISLWHDHVQPFTQRQIDLVATFADQAVIAINNVGLFEEVQARNRDLTALGEVGRAVSSTLDLKIVLKTIVDRAVELSGTDAGSIFYHRQETDRFELGETSGLDEEVVAKFRKLDIATGQTGLGEAIADRQPLQLPDAMKRASNPLRDAALEAGLRAALVVPLLGSEGALGALVLQRRRTGEFPPSVVSLMQTFADQSAIALENARLFDEIARKSRELEIASQHRSQFVANMSHELRTPLAAMLGYAELLQEGIYGALPEKFLPILMRIQSNGKHLLGLINTVLDISKIEAGQFKLNLGEYALGNIVETVMVATESLTATKKLAFKTDVSKQLPYGLGDEQRLTQVLLNLVGNAIKFTDAGEVRITAGAANGHFTVSVSDTGPGIPPEECEHIFEQFRQVDSSNTRAKGGTGLGLAIAREIVRMHGGRIWVESKLGHGSTFRMELPVRAPIAAGAE